MIAAVLAGIAIAGGGRTQAQAAGMCPVQVDLGAEPIYEYETYPVKKIMYRTETYTVPVTKYRTVTWREAVTRYRTETYTVQVPHRVRYSYQVPRTQTYTVSVPHTVRYSYSVPHTRTYCAGWGRWRRCWSYTWYSTHWVSYTYYTTETRTRTYYQTVWVDYTYYTTETRTRTVAYTEYVTRSAQVPYTDYETRTRQVPYTATVNETRRVIKGYKPVSATKYLPCTEALAIAKMQWAVATNDETRNYWRQQADQFRALGADEQRALEMQPILVGSEIPMADKPFKPQHQTMTVTLNGMQYQMPVEVWSPNPEGKGGTWTAVEVTNLPFLWLAMQQNGFRVVQTTGKKGEKVYALPGFGNPNAVMTWERQLGTGSQLDLFCKQTPQWCGGHGTITLNYVPQPDAPPTSPPGTATSSPPTTAQTTPQSPAGGNTNAPSVLVTSVSTAPNPVPEGKTCNVTAAVDGAPTSVTAVFDWGVTVSLTDAGGGRWTGGAATPLAPGQHTVTVTATDGVMNSSKSAMCNVSPAPAAITGVNVQPNPVRFGDWLTVTVTTTGRVDRVTARVDHRRPDLPANRFESALTRTSGAAPGTQTWSARIRVEWITPEEYQVAMCQQDGGQQWVDRCGTTIQPYAIAVTASGTGGPATSSAGVTVQGTTVWVVPVPAGK